MPDRSHLEAFIGGSFRSVWALEILKYLTENPATAFSAEDLIAALRASDAVVSQSVDNLTAAGLVLVDSNGAVALHQGSPEQVKLVRSAIELYRRSPDKVRRLIVAQSSPGVAAFAAAFKLRRD